jgi:hypothetical protein
LLRALRAWQKSIKRDRDQVGGFGDLAFQSSGH